MRKQFGQPIANFQAIQFMLAEMATKIEASRLLVYHAAVLKDAGQPYSKQASMAKLFASETGNWVTDKAIQIHGGIGYCRDIPSSACDAKLMEIGRNPANQKLVIARES
jgi:alkylation response protein AidB-like acyl-CoA dehydrogenase